MKLELKHLAGYLPYGLKIKTNNKVREMVCEKPDSMFSNEDLSHQVTIYQTIKGVGHKPILHPLSDFTKHCDDLGFTPIEWLLENREVDAEYDFIIALEDDWACAKDKIIFAPLSIALRLYEWHFDIHGLIPNGLAIDINTIKPKNNQL